MSTRYCILGGGGSFGLHLAKHLLAHGNASRVLSIGRAPPKDPCFTLGVGDGDNRYSYRSFHVTHEIDLLLECLDAERPQVIFNFAAQGEGAASLKHSWRYFETNCVGLSRLVEELTHRDYLERFVHVGTSELYGATERPAAETDPIQPTSPYAASKAAFDMYLMSVSKHLKFPMNIVRPSNAYGEGQQLYRVIPKAIVLGLTGRKLPLHGGGKAMKSYIYNGDLSRALLGVAAIAPAGAVYNAGPEAPVTIRHVVETVARALNMSLDELADVTPDRQHQDAKYWLDSSAIAKATGWVPKVSLEEGVDRMVKWGRDNVDALSKLPLNFAMRA